MLLPLFLKLRLLILDLINVIKIDLSKVSTEEPALKVSPESTPPTFWFDTNSCWSFKSPVYPSLEVMLPFTLNDPVTSRSLVVA